MMQTILTIDIASVASSEGLTFHLNQAVKHPDNPLLMPGQPHEWDSLQICWPGTVLRDPADGRFRCWYHGLNACQADRPQNQWSFPWVPGYAESADGIRWTKPSLGQCADHGRPTNRIATDFDGLALSVVFPNPDPTDLQRRWLSIWKTTRSFSEPQMPRALASSPDGLAWRLEDPAFYREPAPRDKMQDFWQVIHDPDAPPAWRINAYSQYYDTRSWDGRLVRQIGLHHGPDVRNLRDADPPIILAPEQGIDEELHFASVGRFGGQYLLLFESDRFSHDPLHGDLRLAISADGRSFRRVHPRTPLLPTGPKGSWDENLLVTTSYALQEVGDEVRIYYFGCPNVYRNWPGAYAMDGKRGSLFYPTYLGLATLPRDRFGFAAGNGVLTTHPVTLDAGDVWLNCDGNNLTIDAVSQDGRILSTGRPTDSRRASVYRHVEWSTQPSGTCQLRLALGNGVKLFSLTVE